MDRTEVLSWQGRTLLLQLGVALFLFTSFEGFMHPPHRSRASRMVTFLPARASSRAVIRPAAPAPTITKWVGDSGAID